jgi:hypothetical protein
MSETANHGASTWDYLLMAVVVFCLERQLAPEQLIPNESAKAVVNRPGFRRGSVP